MHGTGFILFHTAHTNQLSEVDIPSLPSELVQKPVANHGDEIDLIIALDKNSLEKHIPHVRPGGSLVYNSDDAKKQSPERDDIQLCPIPYKELSKDIEDRKLQRACLNTCLLGAALQLVDADLGMLEEVITSALLKRKGQETVDANIGVANAGYEHAAKHFTQFDTKIEKQEKPLAFAQGNELMAMGGAAAGVKFYAAYPMSPSTGVLRWMARQRT